jgi:hypothetical protein
MKRIILLTSFPPEGGGGGGVNLRSLFDKIPSDYLFWYSINVDITTKKYWRPEVLRSQFPFHTPGKNKFILSWFYRYIFFIVELIINSVILNKIVSKTKSSLLWVVVDKDNIFQYFLLIKILNIPYHVSVQDDPEVSLALLGKKISKTENYLFKKILQGAKTRDSTSLPMAEYYEAKFNTPSIWLTRSIPKATLNLKFEKRNNTTFSNSVNLILAGWGDCTDPWPMMLIDALDIFEKKYKLNIHLYSFDPSLARYKCNNVTICNRMSSTDFETFIDSMHIGYAPDNLDDNYQLFAETSLSVKMLTYIFNCMPSLYHGPRKSSIGQLFSKYKAGVIVDSNDPEIISNALYELFINYSDYSHSAFKLSKKYFLEDEMHLKVNKILD